MKIFSFCDTIEEALAEVKDFCKDLAVLESCGFLGYSPKEKAFVMAGCDNKSDKPEESFLINPYDHIEFISKYKIIAIFHSHPQTEEPSDNDRAACKNSCLPFLIYGVHSDDFSLLAPKTVDKKYIYLKGLKELKEHLSK
jgi:proteasome lid subunit RPN8/RPN11